MSSESAETIKEFLVSLGFKVDEASGKKFSGAIGTATKDVTKLGASVLGVLAITEAFVVKFAEGMDRLYFASKRTGATVGEINAFSYAVTQLGGSAEGAASALESIASFRRKFGGASDQSLINFGVKPEDIKDSEKSLVDLGRAWAKLKKITGTDSQGLAQANFLGIDEKTYLALTDGSFESLFEARNAAIKQSGINLDELAGKNREFNQSLADTENSWKMVGLELEEHLLPAMKSFNEWSKTLAENLPHMMDSIGDWLLGDNRTTLQREKDKEVDKKISDFMPNRSGAPASSGGAGLSRKDTAINFLKAAHWSSANIAGIIGNLMAENAGFDPAKIGYDGKHAGIAQWDTTRQADFKKMFGHDLTKGTLEEQLQFLNSELTTGKYRNVGVAMKKLSDASSSSESFMRGFEKPGDYARNGLIRDNNARHVGVTLNQTNHTTVNTHGDAHDAGRAVGSHIKAAGNNIVRNMQSAVA